MLFRREAKTWLMHQENMRRLLPILVIRLFQEQKELILWHFNSLLQVVVVWFTLMNLTPLWRLLTWYHHLIFWMVSSKCSNFKLNFVGIICAWADTLNQTLVVCRQLFGFIFMNMERLCQFWNHYIKILNP